MADAVGAEHAGARDGRAPARVIFRRGRGGPGASRIAAEQITPYPPGIPAILPGERINAEVIEYLVSGLKAGMVLPDAGDPKLETVRVVTE